MRRGADRLPVRARLTAFRVHACQSLREVLQPLADMEPKNGEKLRSAVVELIVHDFSMTKNDKVLGVLGMSLKDAQTLVVSVAESRWVTLSGEEN